MCRVPEQAYAQVFYGVDDQDVRNLQVVPCPCGAAPSPADETRQT